jgi:hypothetical protein
MKIKIELELEECGLKELKIKKSGSVYQSQAFPVDAGCKGRLVDARMAAF